MKKQIFSRKAISVHQILSFWGFQFPEGVSVSVRHHCHKTAPRNFIGPGLMVSIYGILEISGHSSAC